MRRDGTAWTAATVGLGGLLVLLLGLPLLALAVTAAPADLLAGLTHPLVGPALLLTLRTTAASLVLTVLLGTPLAWQFACRRGRAARTLEAMLQLPVVVPPAVAGVALLLAFGRQGLLGPGLAHLGLAVPFTTAAVVLAETFVAAPLYVQTATAAFRALDPRRLLVARSLGATPARAFLRIAVPLAAPGLLGGAVLAWARALGEFGATLMFAGSLPGRTQTLPLAIYATLETDVHAAQALALLLVLVAFVVIVLARRWLEASR